MLLLEEITSSFSKSEVEPASHLTRAELRDDFLEIFAFLEIAIECLKVIRSNHVARECHDQKTNNNYITIYIIPMEDNPLYFIHAKQLSFSFFKICIIILLFIDIEQIQDFAKFIVPN